MKARQEIFYWTGSMIRIIEVKTSGSTGPPKKIKIYKNRMINSARATGKFLIFRWVLLHCTVCRLILLPEK